MGRFDLIQEVFVAKRRSAGQSDIDSIVELEKYNPYHDRLGRFSTAGSAASFTIRTKDPGKQHWANRAVVRERNRYQSESMGSGLKNQLDVKNAGSQKKTVHAVEDKIRHQNFESAALVDKDGNVVFSKDGAKSEVFFTPEEVAHMKGNVLTHNHPSSSMFSTADVNMFVQGELGEMRATNRSGTTYSIKTGNGYSKEYGELFVSVYDDISKIARKKAQDQLDALGYQEKVYNGEITVDQANADFRKVVRDDMVERCQKNAHLFGIEFSVQNRNVEKSMSYVSKQTSDSFREEDDGFVIDRGHEEEIDAAFDEWMEKNELKHKK